MARTNKATIEDQLREEAEQPVRQKKVIRPEDLVPTGSTMLNLCCSDTPDGGYQLGGLVTIPGASTGGKTIICLSCLAECNQLSRFDDYDIVLDDAEERLNFDLPYLFGESFANRLKSPLLGNSKTIQNFKSNMLNYQKKEKSVIYVLDSFDSLASDEELEKEMRRALAEAKSEEAAKKIAGSYGAEKAKIAGEVLRMVNNYLERSKSLLIIIQQRRQKMDSGPFGEKFTTSGGEAPFYYSNHQPWLSKIETIKEKGLKVGTRVKADLRKNSVTGKLRDCEFDIFYDYGIDDINSIIDFLVDEEYWKKTGQSIIAHDLDLTLTRKKLVEAIEYDHLEGELRKIAGKQWLIREESVKTRRKPRFE